MRLPSALRGAVRRAARWLIGHKALRVAEKAFVSFPRETDATEQECRL
jgi:hypothetical protein